MKRSIGLLLILVLIPSALAVQNVSITKTLQNDPVRVGDNATFLINLTNTGDEGFNGSIEDFYIVGEINFSGANRTPNITEYQFGEVIWNVTDLAPNESVIILANFTALQSVNTTNNVSAFNTSDGEYGPTNVTFEILPQLQGYEELWSDAFNASFFQDDVSNFFWSGAPYVARGPGCYRDPQYGDSYSTPGENCCSAKDNNGGDGCSGGGNLSYDLAAVWVDQFEDYIGWYFAGPFANGTNTHAFCDGTARDVAFVVEFDIDDNQSTGCSQNESCYPGADYQIWAFPDSNETLFAYHSGQDPQTNVSFTANLTVNATSGIWAWYNCSATDVKDRGIAVIVNKTLAFPGQAPKLNFETNSFNVSEADTNPIDLLTDFGGQFDAFLFDGPGPDEGACFQFDGTDQSTCESNNLNISCVWTDFGNGDGLCDPDFDNFDAGTSCFQFTDQGTCDDNANNGVGFCRWEANIQKPDGTTGLCIEEFKPFEFGGGDCDTDCFNCFNQDQCEASDANGGKEWGGCGWYTDTFRSGGWCDVKGLKLGCANTSSDCLDSSSCASAGWHWNGTWEFCVSSPGTEICFNGVDDDGDGSVDCDDSSCDKSRVCGGHINTVTGTYKGLDPELALQNKLNTGMGPVLELKDDPTGDSPDDFTDINGYGIVVSTFGIGMGMMMTNLSDLKACGGAVEDRKFMFLIDNDANESSGCNVTLDGTAERGFEYMIKYGNYSLVNESANETLFYACYQGDWVVREAALDPILERVDPMDPDSDEIPMECVSGGNEPAAVALMMEKADIGNPTGDIRFMGIVVNGSYTNESNLSSYDVIDEIYYTPGTQEFEPVDCFEEPSKCGSEFIVMGGGDYLPVEECILPGDEDADGLTNCADPDCAFAPQCTGQQDVFNISADKTAPKVKSASVKKFDDIAIVKWVTNEPTNGTVKFYNTDSSCGEVNATITDFGLSDVSFDDFKPWHDVPLDDRTTGSLSSSTTYYYKLVSKDRANNTATSTCLNFTTQSSSSTVSVFFNFTSPINNQTDYLGDLEVLINGQAVTFGSADDRDPGSDRDVNITFRNPSATGNRNWSVTIVGADVSQALNIDFSDAFVANETDNSTTVGMENDDWQRIVQKLGADYILLRIPENGTSLEHCADNGTQCTNVTDTDGVEKVENASTYSVWKLPTTLGFSTYSTEGDTTGDPGSGESSPDDSTSTSSGGGGGAFTAPSDLSDTPERYIISTYGNAYFNHEGVEHRVRIKEIHDNGVTFTVESDPVEVFLEEGETKEVDITADGTPDLLLTLVSFSSSSATIEVAAAPDDEPVPQEESLEEPAEEEAAPEQQPQPEPAPAEETVPGEEPSPDRSVWVPWIAFAVIVLAVALWVTLRKR